MCRPWLVNSVSRRLVPAHASLTIALLAILGVLVRPPGRAWLVGLILILAASPSVFAVVTARSRSMRDGSGRLRSHGIADMSHELRTPLNAILALSDILAGEMSGPLNKEQAKQVSLIHRSGAALLGLINDLVDLSRIDEGRMTVRRAPISTRRLIALVEEDLRPLAEDKALTLTAARAAGLPEFIHADEHMLRRVLVSLVRDRVTLTGRGCVRLDVSLDRDGAAIVFEVSGIGADGASTYTLAIPCEPASPPRADAEAAPSAPDLGPGPVPGDRRATNRHLDRIRCRAARSVLVIDDSIVDSDLIARLLARDDYRVMRASRGEDGLAAAVREKPDLILLDLGMPGMDGFRVIEELKGRVETRDIPVVIHTARNLSAEELTLLPGGARHVFLKNPLDPARILDEIGRLLGSQPIATPSDETLPAGHGRGRILLVEDDAANQYTIGILLRSEGYEVVVASDGFDALARAEAQAPEVILMDMNMPGMGGHQATRALRRMPGTRGIPVIALTAASHAGDREKAIAAGCDDYVSKPIDTGLLLDRIGHWLAARREAPSSEDTALTD